MFHFTRPFRHGSVATLAPLVLVIALIVGIAPPVAFSSAASDLVTEEVVPEQDVPDSDAGTFAWKAAVASSFGPGLWGNRMACGQILRRDTIGVAHKRMPCGTRLKFRGRNGVIVYVRVVDRGPFIAGRTFDLTQAMVQKMGYANSRSFGVRTVSWDYAN